VTIIMCSLCSLLQWLFCHKYTWHLLEARTTHGVRLGAVSQIQPVWRAYIVCVCRQLLSTFDGRFGPFRCTLMTYFYVWLWRHVVSLSGMCNMLLCNFQKYEMGHDMFVRSFCILW